MQGLVLLLDEANLARVQAMAEALEQFGGTTSTVGMPHVTLHAAEQYELEKVKERAISIGRSLPPVPVSSTGIGVFPGEKTYVYLSVIRNPRLGLLQRTVYDEIAHFGTGSAPVWAPNRWVPHITLAQFEHGARTGEAVQYLLAQETVFDFVATEFSVVEGEPKVSVIVTAPFDA